MERRKVWRRENRECSACNGKGWIKVEVVEEGVCCKSRYYDYRECGRCDTTGMVYSEGMGKMGRPGNTGSVPSHLSARHLAKRMDD
jgi:hypothetical protein